MGSAVIVDVGFLNIGRISGSSFLESAFHNCRFRGGVAESDTKFTSCKFIRGGFENIHLKEVDFYGNCYINYSAFAGCSFTYSTFTKCTFRNSSLNPNIFVNPALLLSPILIFAICSQ